MAKHRTTTRDIDDPIAHLSRLDAQIRAQRALDAAHYLHRRGQPVEVADALGIGDEYRHVAGTR